MTNKKSSQSSKVGQLERKTQDRVVALFKDRLKYTYLGNWEEREDNRNIEEELLRAYLEESDYNEVLIKKAISKLKRTANKGLGLYDLNQNVYNLLRYGAKVKEVLGENNKTVQLR